MCPGLEAGSACSPVDVLGDLHEVLLDEAAGGEGGGADTEAGGHHGALVAGHCVLVGCDVSQLEHPLHAAAVNVLGPQVEQHHVVVSAYITRPFSKAAHRSHCRWQAGRHDCVCSQFGRPAPLPVLSS